ncbi:helix-turn-helix domain-containing protein [Nocardia sp. CA-107356]|uniref:helix-turn-helix domain-containing protein n=1 Tax=Nocardia sp. CA-107356 TaxID=3239972 RepID=UPI003D8C3782
MYALDKRPVEMKPGEGKSLMFMAAAMQRAVRHGECLLVTTTDGLAHREFTRYRQLLSDFGIDVFRADQQQGFGPVTGGRPAVVVATGETVGHLCNAGHRPPRQALIDEMDGIIDRGERQFLRSEGVEQAAPEATAREVFAAHDFLADALEKGALSHEDFGLTRIIEEVDVYPDGTPEVDFWYDGRAELTPGGREKVEALPGGKQWLEGLGLSRLETAAGAEFTCRKSTHYVMDAGKIVIIDQGEHGLQRNPKTSSESRWSAEQGKASLAQAVEAKEIRAAEAIRMSAEQHQIVVRADADSAKSINAVEIYRTGGRPEDRFFDKVTGASGTLADLNPVLEKIYGLEEAHQVDRSREQRLMEGAPEVVANTRAKLSTIAEGAHRVWQGGRGRSQEILCHRNDLVDRQVQALVRQGVPREAIEAVDADRIAGWGTGWEAELQKVFDAAGEQGKILVINRQGQRGVDISVSEAVQAKGGMFVWMTEVPEQSYIHEQAKNRTARNGDRGAAQALISPQDALIRKAMHLSGVRAAAVRYEQVAEAHRTDPTPENRNDLVEAGHNLRSLVPELQERALRHATADFIRHHAYITDNPAAVLAAAETFRYQGSTDIGQIGQPDHSPDQTARLARLLGIPASAVVGTAATLEQDGAGDPLRRLLEQTGLPPAAVEALRQQVEATAPATVERYAGLSDEQAMGELTPLRNRLADELGLPIADIDGAEGMRTLDPAVTEARNNLAKALGYPASDITPATARDILGEAVNRHLPAEGTPESPASDEASREDAAPMSANPVSDRVAENPVAEDVIAAASHYLATAALLDLVVRIHHRSPNSCVNNAVTGLRVLSGRDITMPSSRLAGHRRDAIKKVFGAPLEDAGSLDEVAESLKARPGGIAVLVYKWKDTEDTGSTDADSHMVLVVNDSAPGEAPKLVVVDLAASRDGDTDTDYGPKDLRNRRTLLDKAVPFDTWRQKQQKFIDRLPAGTRRFETIDFDVDGNLVAGSHRNAPTAETLPHFQDVEVSAELVQEINSIQPGRPVNDDGTPDLPSRTDADTPDKSDISGSAELARIGSRPHDTPDPTEPAPETGQEQATLSATPEALRMALAVVAGSQCSPDIARDAQRFVMRCYEEYRQQQTAALQEQHRTALVHGHGMTPEEAEQAAWEHVGSAEALPAIDNAAAQSVGELILAMHRTAERAQISLPGSLADLSRAAANTANARGLQQAFALIGRDESSSAQDAKRFVMSCYEEYRQRQETAARHERRAILVNRHGMSLDEAEQAAREHVGSADVRAHIDSAAADNTRRLIHNIRAARTKTSLPLLDTLAHLHQAAATTANARTLAKSMKADPGDTRAPGNGKRAPGDQVGSRQHGVTADSKPTEDAPGDRARDQQQHRESDGRIGGRPSGNPEGRPDGERGLPRDMASADWSADDLLSPASRPLPAEVIGREIDEVTEMLGSRVPPEQLADPEVRRGVRLVAEGLFINRRLYGGAGTGRADDVHDAARHDTAVEPREDGAANRHDDGMPVAVDLRRVLDNGVLQGADLGEIMAAMIADAWADLAHGGGRHGGNPRSQDTVRSAELLHARALAHGCAANTARVLGFAVSGIGFDVRTGTQMIASPAAVAEMRQRWGELTGSEFETAMRVGRWVAAAGLQTLSEPDAVVQWVRSDRDGAGTDIPEDQALIDRLRSRAGFADPDSGYRPPDGWLLANRDMRRDHAAKAREIADRLARDPGYTPLDAYRDSRLHAAEMREEHSGFRWQLVIGPGADTSDAGTLADAVAARLPESGAAWAREDIIDAVARLAELTLPRAGADAVFVVTSSKDADGRRRLLAELGYTRPDATDPAPGVTAEELRRELADIDGRIDVDTADPPPEGQVRHRVRLDLTRQRILVCCRVWGSGGTGMATLNVALCRALAAAGHEVIVWADEIAPGSAVSGVLVYSDRDGVAVPGQRNGHGGGPDDLPQSVDLVIVHAEDGGLRAALAAQTRYPAAKLVSAHHLTPMLWENLRNNPERGRAKIAARIYLARRAHLVTGLGPVLATDALSAAVMAGHGSVHELQPGMEIAEQPREPAPGAPARILLFGRVDDQLKGTAEIAEVVKRLRAQGRDVRLVVRGYPNRGVEAARARLAWLVGDLDAVEVRPFTMSRARLRDDIRAATIVVMPSRAEGFGGVAIEAIEQGVPVAVPSTSGVGRFLAELADYRDSADRFNLVEQPLGAQVPIDNWVAGLSSILDDVPGAWAAARGLQSLMRPYTRENSARMLVHAARNTDPHSPLAIQPSRTQVSLEDGRVVARGEEEDYLRILAVADTMETDPAVREAVISGTRIEFTPSRDPLTAGTASADDSDAGARSHAADDERFDNRPATGRNGGPGGLIGSRPFEDSPGERAFAGPGFEELVRAGLQSGIVERFVVEDAPGVRVEEMMFDNGVRVFKETHADPIKALVQVLQTKVAAIMGAPVAHAMLNLEDDRVYRELTPGRPGDNVEVVDSEVLGSESALRLGLFDAVTGTHRTAREWSVADNEVMGGRCGSDGDVTQPGVFASLLVRRIDGRAVWLDHAMPTWEVAAIREQVSHLETWISNFPMPEEHRTALLDIHGGYVAALAQVERHAVHTFGERVHRAGLDVQAQAKARLVEVFTLNYPHVTVVGFDHPDVPAHVVAEILGGLDEMFTRFPDRTNIRELRIDYTDWEATSPRAHNYADPAAAGRTLSMRFSLRDAANPALTVTRGIRFLEFGLNPVGDRPFHHNAVHGFVHAIDAVEGLSKNLQRMLSQTWGQLSNLGLIEESWWTWLTRLPRYAFVDEGETVLNDAEALAVGFAEADIHGVAAGSPQWAIHEYVTTGRLPQATSDLDVDLPPHADRPDSGGLIGSRPRSAADSQLDAARGAWIEALRLERGMTRKQLTEAAGLANSALSTIESGQRKPRIGTFQRICRALGLDDEAVTAAVQRFYPDVVLDTDVAAHELLGDWVRAVRNSKGMTQLDLAHAVGVDPVRIGVHENGERMRPGLFLRIARVLEVGQHALAEAVRKFYPDIDFDLDPAVHDPGSPGSWIAALRYDRDVSQAELARTAGISETSASRIEGGHTPTSIVFWRICRALGVAPDVLAAAARNFYPDINPDPDPAAHDPASPGSWIVALRHDRDMPQSEVAKAIGSGSGHLYRIESGRNRPRFAVFRRICDVLGVDDELLRAAARHFYSDINLDIEPAAHDPGLPGSWIAALRNHVGMSGRELARRAQIHQDYISQIENQRFRPQLRKLRQLCGALGVGGDLLLEAVERFYGDRFERSGDRDEEALFNRYVVSQVGSPEEREVRDEICARFAWVPNALGRRVLPDIRDEAVQAAWMGILSAIDNHAPATSFAAHAWASGSSAILRYHLARAFPDLDNPTLKKVSTVRAQIGRMVAAGEVLDDAEIARAVSSTVADVALAREILARPVKQLDAPITGEDGAPNRELADPAASTGFSDADFAVTVRAVLADMPDPGAAERLVMLHLVEGMPLADAAERAALPVATVGEVLADAVARLRDVFDSGRSGEMTATERGPAALTPWAEVVAEQDQRPVRSSDPEAGDGGPGGLIGSRPFEDSPSERAFAGPGFEELVLAGLQSGIAERFVVEDAPGVRVEEMTFDNGVRVFAETYGDPIKALVQVLQTEVAAIIGAPVAHAMLNLEDDRVYRERTPHGRPGDSFDVLPPEVLASAVRLSLFDAVTRPNRTGRQWSAGPDDAVMAGRSQPDFDATSVSVFAAVLVRRIDGRDVWQDNALPRRAVEGIREQVTYLESWIESLPAPEEHRDVLLGIHSGYLAALSQIERHAVPTPSDTLHRAGLDVEWLSADAGAKARLVEAFNLKYPYLTMVGFDHPDVAADVVEEILGGLDEMFTRFPDRTNIRELRIDYLGDTDASSRTSWYVDRVAAAGRTQKIHFSLHHAARPAQFVEFGIRSRELGVNPIGDRPFHHDAVHEFIHAIDAKEGLSENLRQVLSQTHSQLSSLGLIDEHWWTWFARLPRYAFGNEAKTVFNDEEALAIGFAEADIHGVAVGSPQWAIHEYVTTGRPPRVTPDLEVDLPPQEDPPASGRPRGLIGSRPHEDDSQSDAQHGSGDAIASEQDPVPLTPWTTTRAEPDQPSAQRSEEEPGEGSPEPDGWIGSRPHEPGEPPRRPTPGKTTPWSREVIGEPHPDHQLGEQPSDMIPEWPADNTPGSVPLTACETEVLARVRQGMTHNEIAAAVDLSVRDVRAHLASVRRKVRNERARLVAASRPAGPPSTTSESDRFRAAMYAALTRADQPDPRELLGAASPEQMERAVQGLSSAHRGALHRLRAGANTAVIRSMALIAALRSVTALAAEHDRSQAVLATALAAASPADLQTALDQLTAAERQLLVNRFGPATSPATFEPDDSVRALRAVDIVRHVAGRIATRVGMPAVDENGIDTSGFQRGQHLVETETYTADECLDAVLDWMDRQDPPESDKPSSGSRRDSSAATADRPDGRLSQDAPPADEPGGGDPIAQPGADPATSGPEEPRRSGDDNDTGLTRADVGPAYRWRSLPVDHGFDDEQQRLADEALHAGGFDDADRLQRWGDRLPADTAQRRATENREWWTALSDPTEPGELSTSQQALIQVYPHQIGNADGLPATIRDHANRLSISRDLGEFIARKPADQRLLNWLRTNLTDAERKQFANLILTRNHLQELDRQTAEIPGSPPVHLLSYDSTAFNGKGKVVVALGNVDTAHTVNLHVPGTNTTSSSLAYQFKPLRNLYEETLRVDPSLELASIIWIGYDAPAGPVNTGYAKAAFRRRARVGGRRLLCDIAAFHATRTRAGTAAPDQLVIRIYGHSYGSVTMFYAGRYGGFAGMVRSATASGSPGAASVRHAAELGIGTDNVYVAASWRDLVTMFGADEPGAWSRFNPRLGLGIDPAAEAFGGKRIGAEFPDSPDFAGVEAVHQGYLLRDPATGLPTEALANVAQITAGRGDTLASVDRRRAGRGVVARPIDSERGRYAGGNRDFDSRERAERVLREHWGPAATPADLVYRWQRRSAAKHAVAAEACAAHAAENSRIARTLGVDDLAALVRVWPEFVGKAGGFPRDVRDQANRRALAKARAALEDAAATTVPTRREQRLREYLLNVEDLLIRAGHLAAAVETPGVPAPTVLLESFDADDPSGGSIIISFGSGDPVAEAWHVDGSDRDLRRLDQRMQLACNHYEVAVREDPERSVRVVVWSGTDGHRLAGDMAALCGDAVAGARLRPERQLVVHGEGGRSAKKALAHESVTHTVGTVVVCGESNLETMGDVLRDVAASVDIYYGVAAQTNSPARSIELPGVQISCRFPSGDAGHSVALLTQARAVAQRVERAPFAAGKTIDDEFLRYVDDRVKASTDSLDNMGHILAGRLDRLVTFDDSDNEPVRFADYIRRERTESAYDDVLPRDPNSGKPILRVTDADHVLARTAIDKRGDRGTEPSDLWHRGLPDDFTRAAQLAVDNRRWWNGLSSDERRAVVAVHPEILGNAPGIPSEVADYANDWWRFATTSAIHARGSRNASRSERQVFRNLYAVDESLTRSVTVHRDVPAPIVSTVGLGPETFGGNGSGTFVIGNCRLEDAEHVVWYVDGVNTRLQSAPSRVDNARNLYEELVRADRSRKVAVVCWMGYEAPANNTEAWAAGPELAEAGGRLFARDVLALRAVSEATFSVLAARYGTSTVCDAAVGGRLDGVFEHRVLVGSPGRGRRFDSISDASCRHSWIVALSGDPVTGFGADAPGMRARSLGDGPFGLGTDQATDTTATRVRAERGFPHMSAPYDGDGGYLDYALGFAAQPSESLQSAAWCLAGRGGELPRKPDRPSVDNPTVLHRIRARVVDTVRDRRAPQLDAALAGDHRSPQDLSGPAEQAATDPVGAGRSRPAEPDGAAARPSPAAGPRIAVQLGADGLADPSAYTDALALGLHAIVVRVGRGAEDVAALDAVCRSAAFEDATLAVEVNAGPRWSDEEVRTKVAEVVAMFAGHGMRGELHSFDQRVLTAAAELAPDCHRVMLINSLTTATSGARGALGWMARAVRSGAAGIDTLVEDARRTGANGLAVPPPLLSEDFVRLAHEAGMRLAVWGVAASGRMRTVLGSGVDEIWTAHVEKLALLRAEVAEVGFRIPEPFARSTPFSDRPPKATPWSQHPDRPSRDR